MKFKIDKLFRIFLGVVTLFLNGCIHTNENPYELSIQFCSCVKSQQKTGKDSLIDLNKCDKEILSKSRLLQIYMSEDKSAYSQSTLDSANDFALKVRDITDSMCIEKIDVNRIKKNPHIKI
jgi:hypothetical protein